MIRLPEAEPGRPDTRSPVRLLLWVGRHQLRTLVAGVLFGIFWMVSQALMPFAIGSAIQDGIVDHDNRALAAWAAGLLLLGATQAFAGVMRHRYAVFNWLQASFRLAQVVAHHAARSGPAVRGRLSTGEVVATVSNDAMRAGGAFDITARLSGAVVSYVVVAVILLSSSIVLGLVVLLGVPLLVLLLGTLIRPLQARQREQREEVGRLTALGADTAAGLRVLRGIGGEPAFYHRYRAQSEEVRLAGVRVALPQSTLDAAQVFVPGLFVVLVTWLGARFALSGRIDVGELVAFYGYAAFLVIPLRTAAEAVDKVTRALVGARRMLDVLAVERHVSEPDTPAEEPPPGVPLADARSGLVVEPGLLTCLVSSRPDDVVALADRLGRFGDHDGVTLGDGPARRPPHRDRPPPHRRQRGGSGALLRDAAQRARPVGARGGGRSDPDRDLGRERRGRARRSAGGSGRAGRRARALVLGRTATAARPGAGAALGRRAARARRADERRRRAHRGADRSPATRGPQRPDDGRRHDEPAHAGPGRPRRADRRRPGRGRGRPPRAAPRAGRLPATR